MGPSLKPTLCLRHAHNASASETPGLGRTLVADGHGHRVRVDRGGPPRNRGQTDVPVPPLHDLRCSKSFPGHPRAADLAESRPVPVGGRLLWARARGEARQLSRSCALCYGGAPPADFLDEPSRLCGETFRRDRHGGRPSGGVFASAGTAQLRVAAVRRRRIPGDRRAARRYAETSVTEKRYRRQLRPVLLTGAVVMDRILATAGPDA